VPVTVKLEPGPREPRSLDLYARVSPALTGDLFYPGDTLTYVPVLEAGQYLFQCDVHPRDMSGPPIVERSRKARTSKDRYRRIVANLTCTACLRETLTLAA
jgi:hypothetical protein